MRVIRLNRAQKVQTVKLAAAQTGQPKPALPMLSPLSEDLTKSLWSQAEELPEPPAPQPESFPPPAHPLPRPGRTVELEWNQQESNALPPAPLNEEPPQVVSMSPMGEVESVQQLVVTFSRPVIALGAEIGCEQRVSIKPVVKGDWHWLDAQTLSFFGESPFARATTYHVDLSGLQVTADSEPWVFTTPTAKIAVDDFPNDAEVQPKLWIKSDLEIDWSQQLDKVALWDFEGNELHIEFVKEEKSYGFYPYRYLFACKEPLEPDSYHTLQVFEGVVAKAGSNLTKDSVEKDFHTFGALELDDQQCEAREIYRIRAQATIRLSWSNRLNREAFKPGWIQIEPAMWEVKIQAYANIVAIEGLAVDGPHVITVSPELLDVHGQQLGEALEIEFDILREPIVRFPQLSSVVVPAHQEASFSFYCLNTDSVRSRIVPVTLADWDSYTEHKKKSIRLRNGEQGYTDFPGSGEVHELKLLNCGEFVKVKINLGDYFPQGLGHVVLQIQPRRNGEQPESYWTDMIWVQRTSLGLSMFGSYTHHQQTALVHDLRTGQLLTDCHSVVEKGTWRATRGPDSALLPVNYYQLRRDLRMYAFTDRHLYRPGEEVFVKGWFRERSWSVDRPLEESSSLRVLEQRVAVSLYDCNYEKTELETLQLSDEGSFSFSHRLSASTQLGECHFSFSLGPKAGTRLSFLVEEFRRPLFEVTVEDPDLSAGACRIAARELRFAAKAKYLAGGALSSGRVSWIIEAVPVHYVPPGHRNFIFGERDHWDSLSGTIAGQLDENGESMAVLETESWTPGRSYQITALAKVADSTQQSFGGRFQQLVTASSICVGIRPLRAVCGTDQCFEIEVVVTDLRGRLLPGVKVEFSLDGTKVLDFDSQAAPAVVKLKTDRCGLILVQAKAADEHRKTTVTGLRLWRSALANPSDSLRLFLERDLYQVGEQARVTLIAPFAGTAQLRVGCGGEVLNRTAAVKAGENLLEFPVLESMRSQSTLKVDLMGVDRKGSPQVAEASFEFRVDHSDRQLMVQVIPAQEQAAPGEAVEVTIRVSSPHGRPLSDVEVCFMAVDEAVLLATDYQLPDPFERFYPSQAHGLHQSHLQSDYRVPSLDWLNEQARVDRESRMRASMAAEASFELTSARKSWDVLAHYDPNLRTDADGQIQVRVQLPDSLTRFRLSAVAVSWLDYAGIGESQIEVRWPVSLQTSWPRFFTLGDRVQLGVLVHNQTDSGLVAQVALSGHGFSLPSDELGTSGYRVDVAPKSQRFLSFPVLVDGGCSGFGAVERALPELIGQVCVTTDDCFDVVEERRPIYRPASAETTALVGSLCDQTCSVPLSSDGLQHSLGGFGGLKIEFSSTALQGLEDAYHYLVDYPFACSEQLASKILASVALEPYIEATQPAGCPSKEARQAELNDWLGNLAKRKVAGGFSMWPGQSSKHYFVSLMVMQALMFLENSISDVPSYANGSAGRGGASPSETLDCVRNLGSRAQSWLEISRSAKGDVSEDIYRVLLGFEAWLCCQGPSEQTVAAIQTVKGQNPDRTWPLESWLFLMRITEEWKAEGLRLLESQVVQTATTASVQDVNVSCSYRLLGSLQRTNAWALSALLQTYPDHPLVPKLAKGLLAHRVEGHWRNTQENVFALIALGEYFQRFEAETPDLVGRAWLDDAQIFGLAVQGRSTERWRHQVPMERLASEKPSRLTVQSTGQGRLYYRAELQVSPRDTKLVPLDRGFSVQRHYRALDRADDVVLLPDGRWQMRLGCKVRVDLNVSYIGTRYHVALVDPLPACFEPINPVLEGENRGQEWIVRWLEKQGWAHHNLRDHQVEAFASSLNGRDMSFSYTVLVTSAGQFLASPARAEEMYAPETFGRSSSATVVVKP